MRYSKIPEELVMGSINEQSPVTTSESESSCDSSSDLDDSKAEHVQKLALLQEQLKAMQDQMRELIASSTKRNRNAADANDDDDDDNDDDDNDDDANKKHKRKWKKEKSSAKRARLSTARDGPSGSVSDGDDNPAVKLVRESPEESKKNSHRLEKSGTEKQRKQSSHKERRNREEVEPDEAIMEEEFLRPMSDFEKMQLNLDLGRLTDQKIRKLISIVQANEPAYRDADPYDIGIDFDALKESTLRKVEWFVTSCLRKEAHGKFFKRVEDLTPVQKSEMNNRKEYIAYLRELKMNPGKEEENAD